MNIFTKISSRIYIFFTTKTVTGPYLYFQRLFILITLQSILSKVNKTSAKKLNAFISTKNDYEVVIKNYLGLFQVNAKNDSFTKSIPTFEQNHHHWLTTPKQKSTFIDIGSNIGFYSILAIKQYGYSNCYSFEASSETFARLQKNIQLNELTEQVSLHKIALSDKAGQVAFYNKPVHTGGSSLEIPKKLDNHDKEIVDTLQFDTFVKRHEINVKKINFIKIDVEGHEYNVLLGMKETLNNLPSGTCIFIEIHPKTKTAQSTHKILTTSRFILKKQTSQNNFLYQKNI